MFFKNRCYNGGNHHKFEPRYDNQEFMPTQYAKISADGEHMIRALKTYEKIYVKDVCVWCGKEIKK